MSRHCWLVKQEPEAYAWADLVHDGKTAWTGVRNFQARNNLQAMRRGDPVLVYHSVSEKQIVGLARVARVAYPDPTAREGNWVAVDLEPVRALKQPVPLSTIKADPVLQEISLVRQSRLSVLPLTRAEFERIASISGTRI